MKRNQRIKTTFIALILLAGVAVISSVSVAFVLTDRAKLTDDTDNALTRLRSLMTGTALNIEPLIAYIIPSDDAHQVC